MKTKICCVFNIAPHYREPIYKLMDKELECDFYLGNTLGAQIKLMDYHDLQGYKGTLINKRLYSGFLWQTGIWKLIFKPYKHYIITGSPGSLSNWVLVLFALLLGKKVYAWTHGMKGNTKGIGKFIEKNFYRLCHKILLYGNFSKEVMIKEGFKASKLIPIYNSLDHTLQLKIRENLIQTDIYKHHFKNEAPVIIYVGRIQKSKKLDLLIMAVKALLHKGTACNLVFVGKDVENNDIHKIAKEQGVLENTWFYGPLYDEKKLGELFYNAAVCVSPGPVGLTALHALTFGCPVLSNDNFKEQMPEYEAITSNVNGDFFINDNMDSMVKTIEKWITLDASTRAITRKEAYKVIDEKWNPKHQINIIKKALNV